MKVVNISQFIEQHVFCHVAATWPKHQSRISRFLIWYRYICC